MASRQTRKDTHASASGKTALLELIADAQAGNAYAFEALYKLHYNSVIGFLLKRTTNHQDAEDLAAETFLRAYKKIGTYNPKGASLRTWLITIAKRLAIDEYDRKRARPQIIDTEGDYFFLELETTGESIEDTRIRYLTQLKILETAQRVLSTKHLEIIVMCYVYDYSVEDAAKALGIKRGTASSRIWYALKMLRENLPSDLKPNDHTPGTEVQ